MPARAAGFDGWTPFKLKDPVTDAAIEGAQFKQGDDTLMFRCLQRDGARTFSARWITEYKLGRGGPRSVTYRFDQQRPISEDWTYTSREASAGPAVTIWVDPARRFARRVLESGASLMLFRLSSRDGDIHDISVPLDNAARAMIRPALDVCS